MSEEASKSVEKECKMSRTHWIPVLETVNSLIDSELDCFARDGVGTGHYTVEAMYRLLKLVLTDGIAVHQWLTWWIALHEEEIDWDELELMVNIASKLNGLKGE